MAERIQTLLTGFGPFGRVVSNPTMRLSAYFQAEEIPGHDLVCATLPVSFSLAPEQIRALLEVGGRDGKPFDYVLMLGVAAGSQHWRVERQGINYDAPFADADGFTPVGGPIVPGGPDTLPATLPQEPQVAAIKRLDLPVVLSDSAGAYLCNHALYVALHLLHSASAPTRAGFLHIPADEQTFAEGITSAPVFPFEQHIRAVRAVLEALRDVF